MIDALSYQDTGGGPAVLLLPFRYTALKVPHRAELAALLGEDQLLD